MIIRDRNQTEYRLIIYVNIYVDGKTSKKGARHIVSHGTHLTTHCLSNDLIRLQNCRSGAKKLPTCNLHFHEKSKCFTSQFYSIIGTVGRLPEKNGI